MTKEQFHKKWTNYWYYYKIHTIVAVIAILVVAVLVKQCVDRILPDATVILVSNSVNLSDDELTSVENMLSNYTADVNHDGHKVVSVEQFFFSGNDKNGATNYTLTQKLGAEIQSSDVSLFVTDDTYYKWMDSDGAFFTKFNTIDSKAPATDKINISDLPDFKINGVNSSLQSLTLSIRAIDSNSDTYKNNISIIKKLLENAKFSK
jgi:hypothetical protein